MLKDDGQAGVAVVRRQRSVSRGRVDTFLQINKEPENHPFVEE